MLDHNSPSLTIIIPTRNRNSLLIKTIYSLLELPEVVSIIVVDDSSLNKVEFKDSKVTVIRNEEPCGEGLSINRGIRFVETQYFAVISDDDPQKNIWLPEIFLMIARKPGCVAYAPSTVIMKNNIPIKMIVAKRFASYEIHYFDFMPCLAGVVVDLSILRSNHIQEIRTHHVYPNDFLQWLKLSRIGKIQPVLKSQALWHIHSGQTSSVLPLVVKAELYLESITSWKRENLNFLVGLATSATFIRCAKMLLTKNKHSKQEIWLRLFSLFKNIFNTPNIKFLFFMYLVFTGLYLIIRKIIAIFQDKLGLILFNRSRKYLVPGFK